MNYDELLSQPAFFSPPEEKAANFRRALAESFAWHIEHCEPYRRFCTKHGVTRLEGEFNLADVPYLPVGVFKRLRLSSVEDASVVRTLQSSATTSQTPSTVVLDNLTRTRQMRTLSWIFSDFFGRDRRPFVILDVDPAAAGAQSPLVSARGAAIRGFLLAASSVNYCMKSQASAEIALDLDALEVALAGAQQGQQRVVLFGFTYVLYASAVRELQQAGRRFSLPQASVIHIGGWKKLQNQAVNKEQFNRDLSAVFGLAPGRVTDIYGFTEQLGLIYPDCSAGRKHCSLASEVLVRDPDTLQPVADGEPGLLEFITPLPHSYPGLAILLDDVGRVVSRERCACGRWGTAFEVLGRARHAEVRGCGDVLGEQLQRA